MTEPLTRAEAEAMLRQLLETGWVGYGEYGRADSLGDLASLTPSLHDAAMQGVRNYFDAPESQRKDPE